MMNNIGNRNKQDDANKAGGRIVRVRAVDAAADRKQLMPVLSAPSASIELENVRLQLGHIIETSSTIASAREGLQRAEVLARNFGNDATVRLMLLQLSELAGLNAGMTEQWAALHRENPEDIRIVRLYACRLVKERRKDEALRLINEHLPEGLVDLRAAFARAELLADVRAHEESDALFRRLIDINDRRDVRIAFAKRLSKRGLLADAVEVLAPVVRTLAADSKAGQLAAALMYDYAFYLQFEPESELAGQDFKIVSMKHAILHFRDRVTRQRPVDHAASVALVTGSLGPGGAERQLTRLACNLQRANSCGAVDGPVSGNVEVLVKQHSTSTGSQRLDFFLGGLLDAGVPVTEIGKLPAISTGHQKFENPNLLRLLEQLPPQVRYGVTRLCPYLRERKFDVVSLWQDGTCLLGALAALLAEVPVIHLVFRGLPPNLRTERDRPEYAVLYRALAEIPGVHFVSNSKVVAQEYARWLGLPIERFHILYNGVLELDIGPSEMDAQKWEAFAARTQDATETIGGVFRLEPDKRPLLWIKLAYRYLKRRPKARFVIVGDGRLLDNTRDLARELGIADRLLLVGLSTHVGFWYSKMDVKLLLSRYEGLPNVLIEAQLLGIFTVSTPAGGACECFIDGTTGHLLNSLEHPDLDEACDKIEVLANRARNDGAVRQLAKGRARKLFAVEAMKNTFIGLCGTTVPLSANKGLIDPMTRAEEI